MKIKNKIAVIGSFTLDLVNNKEQLGGPPLYSGFAVYMLGGIPKVFSSITEKHIKYLPSFLSLEKISILNYIPIFEIIYNRKRSLILRKKPDKMLHLTKKDLLDTDGIIINPVCKEIEKIPEISKPIALDIQGFIRSCEENAEVKITPFSLNIKVNNTLTVFHANYEELHYSKLNLDNIYEMGFKEILISYDEEGFTLHSKNTTIKYKPTRIGEYKVGTGDVLIAAYFILRLNGYQLDKAAEIAGRFVEWFSNEGHRLLFRKC